MVLRKYIRIGLRRDKNFSDLSNSTEALNNLLDTLVDESSSTFISEDLNALRNTFSLGLTNDEYKKIIGSATVITSPNGSTQPFIPRITYQNKLDQFEVFSGQPLYYGGNGLTAKYYDKTSVFENTTEVFSGTPIQIDNFWEFGQFEYIDKIAPGSIDSNGGIEWEGYFIPRETGRFTFFINSSAGFTFDFQTEGYTTGIGTYTEISKIGISSIFAGSGTINTNIITLTNPSNTKYVAIGQSVSAVGIATGSLVDGYSRTTGIITLSPPENIQTAVYANFSGNISFTKTIGQDTGIFYTTYILNQFERYKIRFRYFIPRLIDASNVSRYIQFNIVTPLNSAPGFLRYNNLYSLDYNFSQRSEFRDFFDSSIPFGGGTIGSQIDANDYIKIKSNSKIDIRYVPKTSVSNIIKSKRENAGTIPA